MDKVGIPVSSDKIELVAQTLETTLRLLTETPAEGMCTAMAALYFLAEKYRNDNPTTTVDGLIEILRQTDEIIGPHIEVVKGDNIVPFPGPRLH